MHKPSPRAIQIAVAPGTRLRVLVADDSSVIRLATRNFLLARWQMDLQMVEDGAQAANAAIEREFDLVFMDIEMLVMDGFTATQRKRKFESENPARRRLLWLCHRNRTSNHRERWRGEAVAELAHRAGPLR